MINLSNRKKRDTWKWNSKKKSFSKSMEERENKIKSKNIDLMWRHEEKATNINPIPKYSYRIYCWFLLNYFFFFFVFFGKCAAWKPNSYKYVCRSLCVCLYVGLSTIGVYAFCGTNKWFFECHLNCQHRELQFMVFYILPQQKRKRKATQGRCVAGWVL